MDLETKIEHCKRYIRETLGCAEETLEEGLSLAGHSSFAIGGRASLAFYPENEEVLCAVLRYCREQGLYCRIVGRTTDLLFADEGFHGVLIFTSSLRELAVHGTEVTVSCGYPVTALADICSGKGLAGLTFAYGIPGSLGGAVYMNAGAYNGEMKDVVTSVRWYDCDSDTFGVYTGTENKFTYRGSIYQTENKVILSATLSLGTGDPAALLAECEDYMSRRRAKQPLEYPSAGSTFKRYPGYFTGKLIEEAGLKGFSVGGAAVSEKHAGFVINRGGATAKDVLSLVGIVQEKIYRQNGIQLQCEMCYVPADGV